MKFTRAMSAWLKSRFSLVGPEAGPEYTEASSSSETAAVDMGESSGPISSPSQESSGDGHRQEAETSSQSVVQQPARTSSQQQPVVQEQAKQQAQAAPSKPVVPDIKDFFADSFGEANRYLIREVIGKGSYGIVCSATDQFTGERVAIKKITNVFEHVSDATRILREIKLLRMLKHPDVVEIKHIMLPPSPRDFKDIYVVFELMETDLHQVIKANDDLTPEHHQFFLYQMLRGLKYIHSAKVFHRDLKPKNILANSDCKLKVCDFGLARPAFTDVPTAVMWTDYVATRWYRAPELCGSFYAKYSPAIDIWSVGCIFAEVLLGKPLFPGKNVAHQLEIITDLLGTPPPHVLEKVRNDKARRFLMSMRPKPGIPFQAFFPRAAPGALALLKRLLSFDPAERPSAEEALADPYFAGLHSPAREPVAQPISKMAFEFDRKKLEMHDVRELIYREILEYHPQVLRQHLGQAQRSAFVNPSALDNFKRQFMHLQQNPGAVIDSRAASQGSLYSCSSQPLHYVEHSLTQNRMMDMDRQPSQQTVERQQVQVPAPPQQQQVHHHHRHSIQADVYHLQQQQQHQQQQHQAVHQGYVTYTASQQPQHVVQHQQQTQVMYSQAWNQAPHSIGHAVPQMVQQHVGMQGWVQHGHGPSTERVSSNSMMSHTTERVSSNSMMMQQDRTSSSTQRERHLTSQASAPMPAMATDYIQFTGSKNMDVRMQSVTSHMQQQPSAQQQQLYAMAVDHDYGTVTDNQTHHGGSASSQGSCNTLQMGGSCVNMESMTHSMHSMHSMVARGHSAVDNGSMLYNAGMHHHHYGGVSHHQMVMAGGHMGVQRSLGRSESTKGAL